MSAVKVFVRTYKLYLKVAETAHSAIDARNLVADHRRIAHKADVRLEHTLVFLDPGRKRRTADFFFSFKEEFDVAVELTA